jgi:hypothetical protein
VRNRMRWVAIGALAASFAASVAIAHAGTGAQAVSTYEPRLNPANFVRVIDNPYYPLPRGRVLIYQGVRDGVPQVDRVTVTNATKVLEGITATAVSDVARQPDGSLIERTTDWFAQDRQGNVWYLGEATKAYNRDGTVDTSGSWQAGIHDGEPGIIMQAHPHIPDSYRQEFLVGQAEDTAWTVQQGGSVTVPYGTVHHILISLEATAIEPGSYDQKIYAPGIGIVSEHSLTGHEDARLVRVLN